MDSAKTFHGWMNDRQNGPVMSDDPDAVSWEPKAPEPVKCPYCGKDQYYAGYYHGNGRVQWYTNTNESPVPCKCEGMQHHLQKVADAEKQKREEQIREQRERELARRIEMNIQNSGMPNRFKHRTFETFIRNSDNDKPFRIAKAYADKFEELKTRSKNGLAFIGKVGTGKTHLAAAIANQILETGPTVICMTAIDMLSKIRATYKTETGSDTEVIQQFKDADLLIIDDLGKEKSSEWSLQTIYAIVNSRYENEMPTIITTNYSMTELIERMTPAGSDDTITAHATIDRLCETCFEVNLTGESWRHRN